MSMNRGNAGLPPPPPPPPPPPLLIWEGTSSHVFPLSDIIFCGVKVTTISSLLNAIAFVASASFMSCVASSVQRELKPV